MRERLSRRKFLQQSAAVSAVSTATFHRASASEALTFDEYERMDATSLAELVRGKEVTASELLDTALAKARAVNPSINAIAGYMEEAARRSISEGLPDGPFKGVPFLLKDLSFPMKETPACYGSKLFRDHVSDHDATVVKRYRRAGLVLFARTTVPELGLLPTTESTFSGITRNPYDLDRTAGGSSGGSAAAVAAGIAPMASASDGGGSIRIPASCCGLFGLKPSRSRIPIGPQGFEGWGGLATLHAVTRSVRDSAALLDLSAGPSPGDAYHSPYQTDSYAESIRKEPKKLRVAMVLSMPPPNNELDPECLLAVNETAKLLESLGHNVLDQTDSFGEFFDFARLRESHGILVLVALRRKILKRLRQLGRDLNVGELEPVTKYYFDVAANYTGVQVEDARALFFDAGRSMSSFMENFDVILTPSLATPPVKHGKITLTGMAQDVIDGLDAFTPYSGLSNWTGQPAMSVPLAQSKEGLPIGVQFMGRFGDEVTLLQLAAQLERAQPWQQRRPSLGARP
ncbi:MAG: amidase [Planctomycetota bacterium]